MKEFLGGRYAYDYLIIDCEAGVEHVSRKICSSLDDLIILTDSSRMSLNTIERIVKVCDEVKLEVKRFHVIGNRIEMGWEEKDVKDWVRKLGMEYLGTIPYDPLIHNYCLAGKSLLELPSDRSFAYKQACRALGRVLG